MSATGDTVEQRVWCHCGDWYWKYLVVGVGLSAVEKKCPKCDETKLLIFREHAYVGSAPLYGRDHMSFRQTLTAVGGLDSDEIGQLADAHRQMARDAA